jgi:SAM-dependent methyltransferase
VAEPNATFDTDIPRHYDRHLGPNLFEPYAADLADRLPQDGPQDVLEIACGTGILTRHLLHRLPATARLVATDLSPAMLAFAQEKLGPSRRVQWRQADATKLPFADASFDAACCQFGLMFVPDKAAAAAEARRVLRPGGKFLFNVWDALDKNDLARILHRTLQEQCPDDPPDFYRIPFGYHQVEAIRKTLAAAGLGDVQVVRVEKGEQWPSVREAATGMVVGTPLMHALRGRAGMDIDALIGRIAANMAQECGDPPRSARTTALVVSAVVEG